MSDHLTFQKFVSMYLHPYKFIVELDLNEEIPRRYLRLFIGQKLNFPKPKSKIAISALEDHQKGFLCSQLLLTSFVGLCVMVALAITLLFNYLGHSLTIFGSVFMGVSGLVVGIYPAALAIYIYRNQNNVR